MSTKVTKAQLQDEVERLRAHVDHLETMNAALKDQLAAQADEGLGLNDELIDQLRNDLRSAEERIADMGMLIEYWAGLNTATWVNTDHIEFMELARAGFEAKARQRGTERITRRVFEFNPEVPGDYHRALLLAKQHNGVVRRAAQ